MSASGIVWWQDGATLRRWLTDFIRAEWHRLRPGAPVPDGLLRPGEAALELDSLERMEVAAALSEALHMHESGLADRLLMHRDLTGWCAVAAESLGYFSTRLTVRSSGSTGAPKAARHSLANLTEEVSWLAGLFGPGTTRVLSAVPAHHIYGFLFTVLLPQLLHVPVLDIRQHAPGALPTLARPGDVVVAFPDFWAAAARGAPSGWSPEVTGVTSTAPCPAETAQALAAAGLARLVQIHGSSETAGLGWRDDPGDAYTLMPHWTRDKSGALRRDAELIAPPDRLAWVDERRYHLSGRVDGAVQVGGINVYPARVREVLCQHPAIQDAAVRLMTLQEGRRLKAFAVPRDPASDPAALQAELTTWLAARLSTAEQPRAYRFGTALPTGPIGKAADWPA